MRFVFRKGRKNSSGFSLIEIMISMGLVSVLALVIFALNNFMNKGKTASDAAFQADQFRKDIVQQLNSQAAWRQTLRNNASFTCVRNGDCSAGVANGPAAGVYTYTTIDNSTTLGACAAGVCHGGFDVYNFNAQKFYAPSTPPAGQATNGFQKNGAQCATFSGTLTGGKWIGSSQCPFRLVLWWQAICPTNGTCPSPAIHVKGYTLYAPNAAEAANQNAFNPGNYGIDLILPPSWQ